MTRTGMNGTVLRIVFASALLGLVPGSALRSSADPANVRMRQDQSNQNQSSHAPPVKAAIRMLQGQVVGSDGKPVADAEVTNVAHSDPATDPPVTKTDALGRFRFPLDASRAIQLRARHGKMATLTGTIPHGDTEIVLRLSNDALTALSGEVLDGQQHPVPNTIVSLIQWAYDRGMTRVQVKADAQGHYHFASLWPNLSYSVLAEAPGYGSISSDKVTMQAGETRSLAALRLVQATLAVTGRVVDENGDAIANEEVIIDGRQSGQTKTKTDADGRFQFEALVPEPLKLLLHTGKSSFYAKPIQAGQHDVILVQKYRPGKQASVEPHSGRAPVEEEFGKYVGRAAPEFAPVAWLNSKPLTLKSLLGHIVLLDFWGVGCAPCVADLPVIKQIAAEYASKGLVIVGMHGSGISPSALKTFAQRHDLPYALAIDAPDHESQSFGKTFHRYGVIGVPVIALIDQKGTIVYLGHSLSEAVGVLNGLLASVHRKGV